MDAEDLAARVKRGLAALAAGDPALAASELGPVAADVDFAGAPDLIDVRTRILVLYAQALVDAEQWTPAGDALVEALRAVKRLDDDEGIAAVRALQARVGQAMGEAHRRRDEQRRRQQVLHASVDSLVGDDPSPLARADALLRKSDAHRAEGDAVWALRFAEEALEIAVYAGAPREEVLSRLAIVAADSSQAAEQIALAHAVAQDARDFNLVGAVVRAAGLAKVALPVAPIGGRPVES